MTPKVPFVDLRLPHQHLQEKIEKAIQACIAESTFIRGRQTIEFEQVFARTIGVENCVTVGNGTDALFIALKCLGVEPGDEVITPAFSWISSAETISLTGARPVFCDVDAKTFNLDPEKLITHITPNTRGIVAVHLFGQCADIVALKKICDERGLFLLEDCAQAHLSSVDGKIAGSTGIVGAFSFYPTKNLGALGDAGCIVTNDAALAEKIRRFANHGALRKNDHLFEGMNSRMDTIQAAVLLEKLPFLTQWNSMRRANAVRYNQLLQNVSEVKVPFVAAGCEHTFHIYCILADRRDELQQFLIENGIQTIVHFPRALPFTEAYSSLNQEQSDYPVAANISSRALSLPIYPYLSEENIFLVAEKIKAFYGK